MVDERRKEMKWNNRLLLFGYASPDGTNTARARIKVNTGTNHTYSRFIKVSTRHHDVFPISNILDV